MDNEILKYIFNNDTKLLKLEDTFFKKLQTAERLRFMGQIEAAKIDASNYGDSAISINLSLGNSESKRIHVLLDEATLARIVDPIINGYEENNHFRKGIRQEIERAFLSAAGNNQTLVHKVIDEIEYLILIGGPCRMKCLHDMLKDVFKSNPRIMTQINSIDRTDVLIKEAVAQGAALSQVEGVEVNTIVPYTVSIFHESGFTPVISAGTPYDRKRGTSRIVNIPMTEGANLFFVLSQRNNRITKEWEMHSHIVNVPQEGQLKVNLKWGESGVENANTSVEGCGLPGSIEFPQVKDNKTLGANLEGRYKWYLTVAKDLRRLIGLAQEPLLRLLMSRGWAVDDAEQHANEWLQISEQDLRQCEAIDNDGDSALTDDEIELSMKVGYFEARKEVAIERSLLSPQSSEVLDRVISLLLQQSPSTSTELIGEAKKLLNSSRNCSPCMQFWQQLSQWSHKLEMVPNDHAVASATATAMGALADCLHNQQVISEEEFSHIQDICWRFHGEG